MPNRRLHGRNHWRGSKGGGRPWLQSNVNHGGQGWLSAMGQERPIGERDETADVFPWFGAGGEGSLQARRVVNR